MEHDFITITGMIGKTVTITMTDGSERTGKLGGFFKGDVGYYSLDMGDYVLFIMNHQIRSMRVNK